jgi:serine/threonine-protein kinase
MFQIAVELDPGFALAHARLSSMHARLYHYGFDRTPRRLVQAKEAVDAALNLQPDLAEAHLALGHYYYWGTREFDRALAALDDLQESYPNLAEPMMTRAYIKRRLGEFSEAVQLLEEYRLFSPLDPNVFVALGETHGTLRQYSEAEKALLRAQTLRPDDPYPSTELGLLYLRWRGDTSAARASLDRIPGGESSEACRVKYLVDMFDGDFSGARDELHQCGTTSFIAGVFYNPHDLIRGILFQLDHQPEKAGKAFLAAKNQLEALLAQDPEDHRLHAALGLTMAGLGDSRNALLHGRRATELYPLERDALEAPVLVYNQALIHALLNQPEEALTNLEKVLAIPSIYSAAWLAGDPRLGQLQDLPEFRDLLARYVDDDS